MATPHPSAAANAADALQGHYQLHFAGRPRLTRDPRLLGQLIALAQQAGASDLATRWQAELDAIAAAQAQAGDGGLLLAQAHEGLEQALHRVQRLLAAAEQRHPHALDTTALVAALADVDTAAEVLRAAASRPPPTEGSAGATGPGGAAAALLASAEAATARAQDALAQARAALRVGPTMDRARAGVRAAQLLLGSYATRVAGRPAQAIRPERIGELAAGLTAVVAELRACGLEDEAHVQNCRALAEQATLWRTESQRASAARRQLDPDALAHVLAEEGDAILAEADALAPPGQRAVAPEQVTQLLALCDRIDEVHRQLVGIPLIYGLGHHRSTVGTVHDVWAYLTARLDHALAPPDVPPAPGG